MKSHRVAKHLLIAIGSACCLGVGSCPFFPLPGDGPIAPNISARLGEPIPSATTTQRDAFERGKAVFQKRFDLADGLGPTFNVVFCGACHERPVPGGSAGLYRDFFLAGRLTGDGAFLPSESAGPAGGVLRVFSYDKTAPARPPVPSSTTIFAQRNAIPIFGTGLIAAISSDEILSRADPDDLDGDGISGKPNFDRGFVGRFGRKAQVVSIEGFIRGPLFNHLGITTDPLSEAQRAMLPVDSSLGGSGTGLAISADPKMGHSIQAAAADGPIVDADGVADPEMTTDELFDLISFAMLLAAPEFEPLSEQSERGRMFFHQANCSGCHTPRIVGPQGPIPAYSDFLLHDMGAGLADGVVQGEATGSEFRTQPLWGIAAVGPYLHDGRGMTLEAAILAHGGEAQASRDAFAAFNTAKQVDLIEFLMTLGGRSQFTTGLVAPGSPIPGVGQYGGAFRPLNFFEELQFLRGREVFDRDFGLPAGAGALTGADGGARFNGDSCRACHFDPVIGGSGPRGVNVMRHCIVDGMGNFTAPPTTPNTILHKEISVGFELPQPTADINVFEHRQTPHTFGLGLIDAISENTIRSNEDPNDSNGDGISGRAHLLADGRVGRLGWKAQVPNLGEFVADAMAAEIGLTLPAEAGLSFALTADTDAVPDPELSMQDTEDIIFFLTMMAGPPRQPINNFPDLFTVIQGEAVFASVGCAKCHIPSLPSSLGDVPLFSDLLLHEILPAGTRGIEDGDASQREFRTPPLWGLSQTAPYFHSGEADTIDEAIRLHDGEAAAVLAAYLSLSQPDRDALLRFLDSL